MALLVKYKCEHTINPKHIYQQSINISSKDEQLKHARYINTSERERERDEQSQTRENCFEIRAHLLYVPTFNSMKDFH